MEFQAKKLEDNGVYDGMQKYIWKIVTFRSKS